MAAMAFRAVLAAGPPAEALPGLGQLYVNGPGTYGPGYEPQGLCLPPDVWVYLRGQEGAAPEVQPPEVRSRAEPAPDGAE